MSRKLQAFILLITVIIVAIVPGEPWRPHFPTVAVTSLYNVTEPGTTFLVNITVIDVTDLFMWIINMSWDPDIIQITTGDQNSLKKGGIYYNIYEGPFLNNTRPTTGLRVTELNNTGGTITKLSCTYVSSGSTPSGNGALAMINFTLLKKGTAIIDINGPSVKHPGRCVLQDSSGNEIIIEVVDGTLTESGPPPIWTQFWFSATIIGIIVIILEVATFYVLIKKKPLSKKEKEETLEGVL